MSAPTLEVCYEGAHYGHDQRRSAPTEPFLEEDGVVSAHAVSVFTNGSCWYLAWVLNSKTGWPMLAVTDADRAPGDTNLSWVHVLVETPYGSVLDVTGTRSPGEALRYWEEELDEGEQNYLELTPVPACEFVLLTGDNPAGVSEPFARATSELADAILANLYRQV